MRDIIEILRLSQDYGRSTREIARIVGVARTSVGEIVRLPRLLADLALVRAKWETYSESCQSKPAAQLREARMATGVEHPMTG